MLLQSSQLKQLCVCVCVCAACHMPRPAAACWLFVSLEQRHSQVVLCGSVKGNFGRQPQAAFLIAHTCEEVEVVIVVEEEEEE